MTQQRRYPVGLQDFAEIRNTNRLYIDKTGYMWRMTHGDAKYIFLSRPRRFGKTLLTSTLQYYFEGRKELFEGLAIEKLETEWMKYPVLRFDMSMGKHLDQDALIRYLSDQLHDYESDYGIQSDSVDVNLRLKNLIKAAYMQTGREVVVLIDEYDAPLLDIVHEEKNLPVIRQVMRNFYSPLKACDPYLRFVFLTGITKFSQLSIFSELNNIKNISMLEEYAAVCGISKEELTEQMAADIAILAEKLGLSSEETLEKLIENYDGYHFTWPSPDIFNPYSLLNAFSDKKIDAYWFGTGTPTYLIEMLRKFDVAPSMIGGIHCDKYSFDAPTETMEDATPLLYQSGYLTIKDYSRESDIYTLDIPNMEVRQGLMRSLLTNYVKRSAPLRSMAGDMSVKIKSDDMDGALSLMKQVLGTVPYCDNANSEGHYQQLLYVMFTMLGYYSIDVEVRTPTGRVDIVLRTKTKLYVMELKLDQSAETALNQIDLKDYPQRFALSGLPVVKVGIRFDSKQRTLADWIIV